MLERSPYRKIVSSRSAGRGRIVTVFYSPLNLRHELDYKGQTIQLFPGIERVSRVEALEEAARLILELRSGDPERLKGSL